MEMPIEPPVLRAALIKAEAWSVLSGGMPWYDAVVTETKIRGTPTPNHHPGAREEPEAEIAVDIGQRIQRERDDHCPGDDQVFRLNLPHQPAGDEHHHHGDD